jgi:hypothetical protein
VKHAPCPRCADLGDIDTRGANTILAVRLTGPGLSWWSPHPGAWAVCGHGWLRMRPSLRRAIASIRWAFCTSAGLVDLTAISRRKGVTEREIIEALRRAPPGPENDWARRVLRMPAFRAPASWGGRHA